MTSLESKLPIAATALPLLLEVGCEEIPARFLADAQKQLGERLHAALAEAHLLPDGRSSSEQLEATESGFHAPNSLAMKTYSTPRRLVVYCPQVLASQPDKVEEITGPPAKIAFDGEGKPTRAAQSFAAKNGVEVKDLLKVSTPKGEYLVLRKTVRGRSAAEFLAERLPSVITGVSFPKSMYWMAKSGPRFARPIRWLVALLGEGEGACVVRFRLGDIPAGRETRGHRLLAPGPAVVTGFADYAAKLRAMGVEFDPQERRRTLEAELQVILQHERLQVIEDVALVDWIVNSTEWLFLIHGSFERRFLSLPREILITVMRDHQKYFAVKNSQDELQSNFVAVLNLSGDPQGLIRHGHERVLRARFADAEFFWNADQKVPLRDRLPVLERVTYQAKLGTYADKLRRMRLITLELCRTLRRQGRLSEVEEQDASRAITLCKCDLTTQMVQEFTELQGVVGGLYARAQGERSEVAEAIYDHYLPVSLEDRCPRSLVGAIVSLADKLDSVVSGFAVGLEPTGSSDPFALRRAGNGIIKVLVEYSLPCVLLELVVDARRILQLDWRGGRPDRPDPLIEFFTERLKFYLESCGGLRHDTVRAVLGPGWDIPVEALRRGQALEKVRDREDFVAVSAAAKRTKNILTKSASPEDLTSGSIDTALFKHEAEGQLYRAYVSVFQQIGGDGMLSRDYEKAFTVMATLRPVVDRFFDQVLVMDQDVAVRRNRLLLLRLLEEKIFSRFAHLGELVTENAALAGAKAPAR